jgi:hypothetical protein
MAIRKLPDYDELRVELTSLERREREVSAARRKLHERLARFPSDFAAMRERQLSAERRLLHQRIDALRAELELFPPPTAVPPPDDPA